MTDKELLELAACVAERAANEAATDAAQTCARYEASRERAANIVTRLQGERGMTTNLEQAARQALDALERYQVKRQDFDRFADEIIALREALAEIEPQRNKSATKENQNL